MASTLNFVEYVCEQISDAGSITYKKMFGEYGIYCNGKILGLICNNQFFVKKTVAGASLLSTKEASPYPGAKPHFVIDFLDERESLREFIIKTCEELPMPKPKKKK
ncbi:TfoX domain-containing protein [Clostridium aceticum]|uniref:TfoX domain-containing protein n=1 Tax=Clostridium aceticum TaxID=84022 RepID=A0A0D8IG50_9CLOT|nr:TfoX/Sxy family protein [Clostridium aceticum]AKL94723.1 TfoX domain-containing protein [Clostridium aceticum]KJF28181.1 competence protein TfoX [Clostridium aceticum]